MTDPSLTMHILSAIRAAKSRSCVARTMLGLFMGSESEREKYEFKFSEICKSMAKTVFVDCDDRCVFIGENPEDDESALVEYHDMKNDMYSKSFFKRYCLFGGQMKM